MAIQHIVHPTDFSDVALNTLRFAADLARHAQAQLHLVHVYERAAGGLATLLDACTSKKNQAGHYISDGDSIAEYVSKHLKTVPLLSFKDAKQKQ